MLLSSLFLVLLFSFSGQEHKIANQSDFDRLATTRFEPGDRILFKRGQRFEGAFAPTGNGTKEAPIVIGSYGSGKRRPRIDALGKHPAGLLLQNPSFWEVDGLEITNTNGSDKDQGNLFGIRVLANDGEKTYEHVYINDCYIHDVNSKVAGKRRGGIHVHIEKLKSSIFHDLRITNNRIVKVGGVGIGNSSSCSKVTFKGDKVTTQNLWTKVYVGGNYVDRTGRNNVIARSSKDAVYEHNVLAHSSRYSTGHSIFCYGTDGIKIQYNEAYGNTGEGGIDRGGFDADFNCVNTFIQYNYSHDNHWFCGIMKKPNHKVVIRYNVSQNETKGFYFYGFDKEKDAKGIHIYNNTHFVDKKLKNVRVFPQGRTPLNTVFENNIFYFEGRGKWGKKPKGINVKFANNLYYGIEPHESETNAIQGKPKFYGEGKAGTDIDLKTMKDLRGYRLRRGSPGLGAGSPIKNNGGQDILNNQLKPSTVDLGAIRYGRGQ